MEWMGLAALGLVCCLFPYMGRIQKLERRIKKLERATRGGDEMSKLITALIGQQCKLTTDEALALVGKSEVICTVTDADDEWISITYTDKTKREREKIMRIEKIDSIEPNPVLDEKKK